MEPAYSVILFTSASGAGYGLLIWLSLARLSGAWEIAPLAAAAGSLAALALVTTGLLASMFHLGHPERAWRAVSQWRSSWLSREGVSALLAYPPALLFAAAWVWEVIPPAWMIGAAVATSLLSLLTVYCTGMIYASLKTIPRWHNGWVLPVYLALALASGGLALLVLLSLSGSVDRSLVLLVLAVLVVTWLMKWSYWRDIDRRQATSDPGTATGLGHLGEIRQLEAPHTSDNYLLKEMGFQIARKHAARLRRYALLLGLPLPALLLAIAATLSGGMTVIISLAALVSGLVGVLVERWLFFAEARHVVILYYGRSL